MAITSSQRTAVLSDADNALSNTITMCSAAVKAGKRVILVAPSARISEVRAMLLEEGCTSSCLTPSVSHTDRMHILGKDRLIVTFPQMISIGVSLKGFDEVLFCLEEEMQGQHLDVLKERWANTVTRMLQAVMNGRSVALNRIAKIASAFLDGNTIAVISPILGLCNKWISLEVARYLALFGHLAENPLRILIVTHRHVIIEWQREAKRAVPNLAVKTLDSQKDLGEFELSESPMLIITTQRLIPETSGFSFVIYEDPTLSIIDKVMSSTTPTLVTTFRTDYLAAGQNKADAFMAIG